MGLALVATLAAIGVGSGLFHTFANGLDGASRRDGHRFFVFVYVFAVNRHVLGWSRGWPGPRCWRSPCTSRSPRPASPRSRASRSRRPTGPSAALIAGYGVILWPRRPALPRGLLIGAAILSVSITARSLDLGLCAALPGGTHFLWHILNAIMLGWMIETYRRAAPAEPTTPLAATPPRG
jgi:hypothetical protein